MDTVVLRWMQLENKLVKNNAVNDWKLIFSVTVKRKLTNTYHAYLLRQRNLFQSITCVDL